MELFNALIQSGLITETQVDRLSIRMYSNSGIRKPNALSIRFIVFNNEKPICAIKKIVKQGAYDLNSIIDMQRRLTEDPQVSSPKLLNIYAEGSHVYLIEEYVDAPNLEDAISQGDIRITDIVPTLKKVFHVLLNQSVNMSSTEIREECEVWFAVAGMLELEVDLITLLRNKVNSELNELCSKPIMTSRDILLRNILVSNDNLFLVDFDLSRKTSFPWIDLFRTFHYNHHLFDMSSFDEIIPMGIDMKFLRLLFLLSEVDLQCRIIEESYLKQIIYNLKAEIFPLFDDIFGTQTNEAWISSQIVLNMHKESSINPIAVLYWKNGTHIYYSEEHSEKTQLIMDDQWHIYKFEIPDVNITDLRIDPSNESVIFDIRNINLIDEAGSVIKEVNVEDLDFSKDIMNLSLSDQTVYVSWSNDPQIIMNQIQLDNCKYIQFELRISNDPTRIQDELNKRNGVINRLENQIVELEEKNNELVGTEAIQNNLIVSKDSLIETYQNRIHILEHEIDLIVRSKRWRWSQPLVRVITILRNSYKLITNLTTIIVRREYKLDLKPHSLIEASNEIDGWESLGDDPQFVLIGKFPVGWVRMTWESNCELPTTMSLYWDNGHGFVESSSIIIGQTNAGNQVFDFFLDRSTLKLRLDPATEKVHFNLNHVRMFKISRFHIVLKALNRYFENRQFSYSSSMSLVKKMYMVYRNSGLKGVWDKAKAIMKVSHNEKLIYETWMKNNELNEERIAGISQEIATMANKPVISIVLPVYNVEEVWLRKCIESVKSQIYPHWELCIADDASTKPHIQKVLTDYMHGDPRIKVIFREKNGHISASSNSALELVTGSFFALLDHDDELSRDALYEVVKVLNEFPDADMIYSDEDKISPEGVRHTPYFKPGWSPDTLLSQMYTCHLGVYRTSLVREIGGFRLGFEGSQDHDLVLRLTERTNRIHHIPKVLYHWRTIPESTASGGTAKSYTNDAGLRAVNEALTRRNLAGWVESDPEIPNVYIAHPQLSYSPLVSIIIPTRDMAHILRKCLSSLFEITLYANFEVIIADNGSVQPETHELFNEWLEKEPSRFFVERIEIPFNFSTINNIAVKSARGELILFLNNDIEIITPEWLGEMSAQAIRSDIGAVGACLLYPDNTIQHGGIVLGIGGIAGHSHKYFNATDYGYFSRLRLISNYAAVTAACLMVRMEVFSEVQGFDENLSVAFNDVDFCLRIMSNGYRNIWLPQVKLYHHESKSRGQEDSPAKVARFQQEIIFMQQRWGQLLINDPYYNKNLTLEHENYSLANS